MIERDILERCLNSAMNAMSKVFPKSKYKYTKNYMLNSLSVESKSPDERTYIFLRMLPRSYGLSADLCKVNIDPRVGGDSLLVPVLDSLSKSRSIRMVYVSSALTAELHAVCTKCKMTYVDGRPQYYRKATMSKRLQDKAKSK